MKTNLLLLMCVFAFVHFAIAQNERAKAIKINYLSPLMGALTLHAEYALNDKNSINLFPTIGFRNFEGNGVEGWSVGLEYRHYYKGKPTKGGSYIAPYLRYRDFNLWGSYTNKVNGVLVEQGHKSIPINMYGFGFVLGKQWQLGNSGFLIDLFGGPDINGKNLRSYTDDSGLGIALIFASSFNIRLGSTIGYRF